MEENNLAAIPFCVLNVANYNVQSHFKSRPNLCITSEKWHLIPWHGMASGHSGMLLVDSGHGQLRSNILIAILLKLGDLFAELNWRDSRLQEGAWDINRVRNSNLGSCFFGLQMLSFSALCGPNEQKFCELLT